MLVMDSDGEWGYRKSIHFIPSDLSGHDWPRLGPKEANTHTHTHKQSENC